MLYPTSCTVQGLIAVVGPRSLGVVVSLVAAIKRGSPFLLVDDELPAARIHQLAALARPMVVSCDPSPRYVVVPRPPHLSYVPSCPEPLFACSDHTCPVKVQSGLLQLPA